MFGATSTPANNPVSPAEIINWNAQAQKPAETEIRSEYNLYLGFRKVSYVLSAFQSGDRNQILTALFQTAATPFTQAIGCKGLTEVTEEISDLISFSTNPDGWILGKISHTAGNLLSTLGQSCVSDPEWKDIIDITCSEGAILASQRASEEVGKKRKRSYEKATALEAKRQKVHQDEKELQKLVEKDESLKEKNALVQTMSHDPQYIANCGYYAAEGEDNKEKVAIAVSKEVNKLSITDVDLLRNTDTFETAQEGSKKHRNGHVVARVKELIPLIFEENAQALQQSSQQVQNQTETLDHSRSELSQAEQDLDFFDRWFAPQPTKHSSPLPQEKTTSSSHSFPFDTIEQLIENIYVESENSAVEASNQRLEIAKGAATRLCLLAKDDSRREEWTLQIFNSMDGSGRRWFNDACGEIYLIMFGTTTDAFVYKERGFKKGWSAFTSPFKTVLSWLDKHHEGKQNEPFTIGGGIDFSGQIFLGPSTNPHMIPVLTHETPSPAPINHLFPPSLHIELPIPNPQQPDDEQHSSTQDSAPTTNIALDNVNSALSIAGTVTGHSGLGVASQTITFAQEIQNHGFVQGVWNGIVEGVSSTIAGPGLNIAVAISNIYRNNVPQESACQMQADLYEQIQDHNSHEPTVWTQMEESDTFQQMNECTLGDNALRLPSEGKDAIVSVVKF